MVDHEWHPFDATGMDIDPSLGMRYRFGQVTDKPSTYPECIRLDFSFQRSGRPPTQDHLRYGRFWERDDEPTDEDYHVLMVWAKQCLADDLRIALAHEHPSPDARRFMRREF